MNTNHGNSNVECVRVKIRSVTGTEFELEANGDDSIAIIKEAICKKLSIAIDDFSIQYNYKELCSGTLASNGIVNDSQIMLTPAIKSGCLHKQGEMKFVQNIQHIYVTDKTIEDFFEERTYLGFNVRSGANLFNVRLKFDRPPSNRVRDSDTGQESGDDDSNGGESVVRNYCKKRKRKRKLDRPRKLSRSTLLARGDDDVVRQALIDFRFSLVSDMKHLIPDGSVCRVYVRLESTDETKNHQDGDGATKDIDLLTILNAFKELLRKRVLNECGEIVEQFETKADEQRLARDPNSQQEQITFDKMQMLRAALKQKKDRICAARKKPDDKNL